MPSVPIGAVAFRAALSVRVRKHMKREILKHETMGTNKLSFIANSVKTSSHWSQRSVFHSEVHERD